ncbi:MAG: hypothetical protein GY870_16545 [archaeon]|nr:hypothetical protein [archaeon]
MSSNFKDVIQSKALKHSLQKLKRYIFINLDTGEYNLSSNDARNYIFCEYYQFWDFVCFTHRTNKYYTILQRNGKKWQLTPKEKENFLIGVNKIIIDGI